MINLDLSNLRMLSKGKSDGLRVYELVDDYVNFVDAEVRSRCPSRSGSLPAASRSRSWRWTGCARRWPRWRA